MNMIDVITDKKLGKELTQEEIELFVDAAAHSSVPDYQLARVSGTLLSILLPVFTLLLSWRQRDTLRQALLPLLLPAGAPAWLEWICYGILTLTAVLLALLPGLWTLLLARRPLPPASSKKP